MHALGGNSALCHSKPPPFAAKGIPGLCEPAAAAKPVAAGGVTWDGGARTSNTFCSLQAASGFRNWDHPISL